MYQNTYGYFAAEEIEQALEDQGIALEYDIEQLGAYIDAFGWLGNVELPDGTRRRQFAEEALADNLAKWVYNANEYLYAENIESGAAFAEYYLDNYETEFRVPSYLVVDYEATWDNNLRHDFALVNGYVFTDN